MQIQNNHKSQHLNKIHIKPYYVNQPSAAGGMFVNPVSSQKKCLLHLSFESWHIYGLIWSSLSLIIYTISIFSLFSSYWCSIFLRSWSAGITCPPMWRHKLLQDIVHGTAHQQVIIQYVTRDIIWCRLFNRWLSAETHQNWSRNLKWLVMNEPVLIEIMDWFYVFLKGKNQMKCNLFQNIWKKE